MPSSITTSVGVGGSTATLTSGSISPSGSNTLMLAAACGQAAATDTKSGGSGGTSLSQINSNVSVFSGNYAFNVWRLLPGPTGSTTAYGNFGSAGANSLGAIYLDGVNQTTPLGTEQTAGPTTVSTVSSTVASITVTGLTAGQRVVAALGIGQIPDGITSVTAGANTTVYGFAAGDSGERHSGAPWLTGVATGTSLTLSATIAMPNIFNDVSWAISAWPVNDAAGGTDGTATGVTMTVTSSVVAGTATGNATANGATMTVTSSVIAGTATGGSSSTAAGATMTVTSSVIAGTATGVRSPTALGAVMTVVASLLGGSATGDPVAPGTLWPNRMFFGLRLL